MESSKDLINTVYQVAFQRDPDPEGLKDWTLQLMRGTTPLEFLRSIQASKEFKAKKEFWDRMASSGAEIIMPLKNGGKLCCPAKNTLLFQEIVNLGGIIKPHITGAIQEYLAEGDTYIDIGANIGFFAITASRIVGPNGQVISFEPFPENFTYLKKNIELNKSQNIFACSQGLWDTPTRKSIIETAPNAARIIEGNDIEMIALDNLNVKPDMIRMNIAGSEPFALRGMIQTLEKYKPILLLEFNPVAIVVTGGKITDFWKLLEGYKIYKIPEREYLCKFEQLRRVCPDHSITNLLALP